MDTPNVFAGIFSPQPWEVQDSSRSNGPNIRGAQTPLPSIHSDSLEASTPTSTPSSTPQHPGTRKRHRSSPEKLPLLQLAEWDKDKSYKEDPPEYIRYHLGLNVTLNSKSVLKDTKTNLALAPAPYWQTFLRPEMEQLVQKTFGYNSFARAKETSVVVSVTARSEPDLTKRYDGLNVDWNEIEDQLIDWSRHFQEGKKLRVNLTFKYSDKDAQPVRPSTRSGGRRGVLSATQRMLNERDAQLDAEQESTGHASVWRDVYQLMRCPGPPCPLGPHCWIDPNGKKHFKLSTFVLKEMIKHVENNNILNDHDQVPSYIRDLIYAEDRHRLDRKRKATTPSPAGMTPITINNHFPEHSTSKLPCSDQSEVLNSTHLNDSKPLTIPGLRDVSVREYTAWQQTQVQGERLKAEFGKARDEVLRRGYDLETIHEDQNLAFMNEKVEPGIIRRFARDIPIWARQYKHGE